MKNANGFALVSELFFDGDLVPPGYKLDVDQLVGREIEMEVEVAVQPFDHSTYFNRIRQFFPVDPASEIPPDVGALPRSASVVA